MHRQLAAQRRILIVAYRRFLASDRALQAAQSSAERCFPEVPSRSRMLIGNPGSRVRRLYERRERALARLTLARRALEQARMRLRQGDTQTVYLIGLR